jgi:hypothetical protein
VPLTRTARVRSRGNLLASHVRRPSDVKRQCAVTGLFACMYGVRIREVLISGKYCYRQSTKVLLSAKYCYRQSTDPHCGNRHCMCSVPSLLWKTMRYIGTAMLLEAAPFPAVHSFPVPFPCFGCPAPCGGIGDGLAIYQTHHVFGSICVSCVDTFLFSQSKCIGSVFQSWPPWWHGVAPVLSEGRCKHCRRALQAVDQDA